MPPITPEVTPDVPERVPVPFDEHIFKFIHDREKLVTDPERRASLDVSIREGAERFPRFSGFAFAQTLGEQTPDDSLHS